MNALFEMALANALVAAVLAVLAAVVGVLCRRPALTHSLWLLVLLKLVTPPLVSVPIPWPDSPEATAPADSLPLAGDVAPAPELAAGPVPALEELPTPEGVEEDLTSPLGDFALTTAPSPSRPAEFTPAQLFASCRDLLGPVWLAGALFWFGWTGWHICRFQRLLRHARPARGELKDQADRLARLLGLERGPAVWLVHGAISPMVWAVGGRARLLFPARLLDQLEPQQRATLLVHELAHLRRRDHWVRWLELLALGLFWWHPVAWWARHELHEAEEQCCDAWVLWALEGASRSYALALLQTVAFFSHGRSQLPAAASGIGQVPHLRRRLTMIMQGTTPRSLSWAGCLGVLALGLLLPVLPVQAQDGPRAKEPASKDTRDEQIEVLKRAIKILEEQKHAEKAETPKVDPAEMKKIGAELQELRKQYQVKQLELRELEVRMREVAERAKLMGAVVPPLPGLPTTANQLDAARLKFTVDSQRMDAEKKLAIVQGVLKEQRNQSSPVLVPAPKQPQNLEQRLDRLLKEVEELRREIRRPAAQGTISPPTMYYRADTTYTPVTPPATAPLVKPAPGSVTPYTPAYPVTPAHAPPADTTPPAKADTAPPKPVSPPRSTGVEETNDVAPPPATTGRVSNR